MSPWLSDLFLSSQSDERLVSLAGAGHDRAFAVIVERYRPELHAHARKLSSDGRAEDIVQQTFLSAFTALRSGTEVQHLRGWLYQIARHAATRVYRPRDASLDEVGAAGEPLEDVVQERALALNALSEVGRLPDRQREALVGTVQGRRRAEIALSMGLSEGAVRQLVHRARMSVRAAVTAVTPFPLARWIAARSANAGPSEVAMSAGAAAAGGATMKLGALLASGVIAGGIVVGAERTTHAHHAPSGGVARQESSGTQNAARAAALSSGAPRARRVLGTGGALGATLPAALRGGASGAGGHEGSEGADGRGPGDDRGETRSGSHGGDGRSGGATGDGGGPGPSGTGDGRSPATSGEGPGGESGSGSSGGAGGGEDSGSGTSGSGTSGSGSSGSGSSGSGSSGSGSSGSGNSGSGDGGGRASGSGSEGSDGGSSTSGSGSGSSGPGGGSSAGTTPDGGGSGGSGGSEQTSGSTTLTGSESGKTSGSTSGSDSSSTTDPTSGRGSSGSGDGSGGTGDGGSGGHGG